MRRIPEPELMLDDAQVCAYAAANFDAPHSRCIELLRACHPMLPERGRALDLGCGPGDITLRVARLLPAWRIDAVDGSPPMLALARAAANRAGLAVRIDWHLRRLGHDPPPAGPYTLVVSNSLLHHLENPSLLWSTTIRCSEPGTFVFAMDLTRPADEAQVDALVARYAADEPEVLRRDFANSLRAAYRPDEIREQLAAANLAGLRIEIVSDRHVIVHGRV